MYIHIDQRTLHTRGPVPAGPLLVRSVLTELACRVPFRGFGVKYVERGVERYTVNGREYAVRAGQYLLVNSHCTGNIVIDSRDEVDGLCVELPERMMDEVLTACVDPEAMDEGVSPGYFSREMDLQLRHGVITHVGVLMKELLRDPLNNLTACRPLQNELYFAIAEALLLDHRDGERDLRKVSAIRTTTRKEILRRVERGRAMMHDRAGDRLTVEEVARAAAMSEYHFSRAFRSVHGRSPYQYLVEVRVQKAKGLLRSSDAPLTEIALSCGHADIHAFSKSFKRVVGVAPSTFRGSRRN
jgi:AraC-like DNA-binding protein